MYKFISVDSTNVPFNDLINWELAKDFVDDNLNKLWNVTFNVLATKYIWLLFRQLLIKLVLVGCNGINRHE